MKKRYDEEYQLECLELLRRNDYNYKKTARETGISKNTLKSWNERKRSISDSNTELSAKIAVKSAELDLTTLGIVQKKQQLYLQSLDILAGRIKKALEAVEDNETGGIEKSLWLMSNKDLISAIKALEPENPEGNGGKGEKTTVFEAYMRKVEKVILK